MDGDELTLQIWEDEGGAVAGISPQKDFGRLDKAADLRPLLSTEHCDNDRTKVTREPRFM
jgi:hypothetical protein